MIRILALDAGRTTGVAVVDVSGASPTVVIVRHATAPKGCTLAQEQKWLGMLTSSLIHEFGVDAVAYERAVFMRQPRSAEVLFRLYGEIEKACEEYGVLWIGVAASTAKKALTGRGDADKGKVFTAARELYPVETQDEADALSVGLAAAAMGLEEVEP